MENEIELRYPSLNEIRLLGQKPDYRKQGNWLARYWARPSAVYGTWFAVRIGLTAKQVTLLAAFSWAAEAIAFSSGTANGLIIGSLLGLLGFWLDHVDGQVARVTNSASKEGVFFDFWMHSAHGLLRAFGIGWGAYQASGNDHYIIAGMLMAFGWLMLSMANDAKYKAMFAILKCNNKILVVKKMKSNMNLANEKLVLFQFRTLVRFLFFKLQEPHIVLIIISLVSILCKVNPKPGMAIFQTIIIYWATTSPVLAIARLWKMIRTEAVEREFQRYFEEMSV